MQPPADGKPPTKVPFQPREPSLRASITNPEHHAPYEVAAAACASDPALGLGVVLSGGLAGVDLDHCLDERGTPTPWARTILGRLPTYTELSPSKRGLHFLLAGQETFDAIRIGGIEVYTHSRYFTVTGESLGARPLLRDPAPLRALVADLLLIRSALSSPALHSLWAGETPEDASTGDFALVSHLLRHVAGDQAVVDRLFRLSGRMRPKWDERRGATTYGAMTIQRASERLTPAAPPEPTPKAPALRPALSLATWAATPPARPQMLVARMITDHEINLVGGVAMSGKSTMLLDIAASVASGHPAFGHEAFAVAEGTPVLYVYGEQGASLWYARTMAVLGLRDLPVTIPLSFLDATGADFATQSVVDALAQQIDALGIRLVVLDSVTSLFRLKDQNDASLVADRVRSPLQRLVASTGCAVIPVHHAAKVTRREEPHTAADCLRGTDEFVAMAGGSILGVWWSREYRAAKVMTTIRSWGEEKPFMLQFASSPQEHQPEMDLSSPPISAMQFLGWWDDAKVALGYGQREAHLAERRAEAQEAHGGRLLHHLETAGTALTLQALVEQTGRSLRSTRRDLQELHDAGWVQVLAAGKRGRGTPTLYEITNEGRAHLHQDPDESA